MIRKEDEETLEQMVDRHTLAMVLLALSRICGEKEQHLIENWQDTSAARHWSEMANRLDTEARAAERKFGR